MVIQLAGDNIGHYFLTRKNLTEDRLMKREYYGCTCKTSQANIIFQWQPQKQAPSFEGSNNKQSCL